ncbi:MAG: type II toxin-antitoxin system death-on-curing family toxin [Proteobacteria bacterium]|nr:type II toxin-antitoxin system death-on-curing family toxin [Pseudomonadota bacterium]
MGCVITLVITIKVTQMSIRNYCGLDGIRDIGLLQSALARPQNIAANGAADVYLLAAAYGFGITRNYPFLDGNKRTAFLCTIAFLRTHNTPFKATQAEAAAAFLELAAGNLSEEGLAGWLRGNCN